MNFASQTSAAAHDSNSDSSNVGFTEIVESDLHIDVDGQGRLMIEGVTASSVMEQFGSPCYVVSEATLRSNFRRFRDAFESRWPAPVNILYAIKANNNLAIRAIFHEEGAGGDCFGLGELYATFAGGADPEKVVLNGSSKQIPELREAVRLGIRVNIDNEQEIGWLAELATELNTTVRVNLRLKVLPPSLDRPSDYFGSNLLAQVESAQWGYERTEASRLVQRILSTPGLQMEGFHLHIGRGTTDPTFYSDWATELATVIVHIREKTGFVPRMLDIGGGYPRQRDPESRSLELNPHSLEEYAAVVTAALLKSLKSVAIAIPELWLEPGRYLVGNAVTLIGTVGAVKRDLGRVWINTDFSINNLMRVATSGSAYHLLPADRMNDSVVEQVNIVGPLCTGAPLGKDRWMPHLNVGDCLAVLDAGMYAETASTQLNGVPRPATALVNGEEVELIKRRESVEDVFANHRIPLRLDNTAAITS